MHEFGMAPEIALAICRQVLADISNPGTWAACMEAPADSLATTVLRAAHLGEGYRPAIRGALIRAQWRFCFEPSNIHGRPPQLSWVIRTHLARAGKG